MCDSARRVPTSVCPAGGLRSDYSAGQSFITVQMPDGECLAIRELLAAVQRLKGGANLTMRAPALSLLRRIPERGENVGAASLSRSGGIS